MSGIGSESLAFANMVRNVGGHARAAGLTVPGYRSPPSAGLTRSIRQTGTGYTVAVRVKGRTGFEVLTDIVDGLAAANDIGNTHPDIATIRTAAIIDLAIDVPPVAHDYDR